MPVTDPGQQLREQLSRWVSTGLIEPGQARDIEAAEAALPRPATAPRQRGQLVAEALGYLGAAIAIGAGAAVIEHFWHNVPAGAVLGFTGAVAVGLLVTGAVLRVGSSAPVRRLRSVLWLVATASTASFFAVLGGEVLTLSPTSTALLAEGTSTALAVMLWWRTAAVLQHLAAFAGVASLAATSVYATVPETLDWAPGLAVWVVAALWAAAAYRGYLIPATAGMAAACVGLLTGAQSVMRGPAAGQVLAVGTVAVLLAAGIALRRVLLLAFGAAGALIVVPQTADRYLPGSALAALSACTVGLLLLATSVWLARSRRAG